MIVLRKYLIGLLLLAGTGSYINAQSVPGYLGSRKIISYEGHLFPSFVNGNSDEGTNKVSLNYQHHLRFDWVASKAITLGLDLGYLNTNIDISKIDPVNSINPVSDTRNPEIRAFNIALAYRWQKKQFAPLARYTELKFGRINYTMDPYSYTAFDEIDIVNISEISGSTFYMGLGIGVNRALTDHIFLSLGADINFLFKGSSYFKAVYVFDPYFPIDGRQSNDQETFENMVQGRLFAHYLFNLKVGVGYMF